MLDVVCLYSSALAWSESQVETYDEVVFEFIHTDIQHVLSEAVSERYLELVVILHSSLDIGLTDADTDCSCCVEGL